MTKPTDEKIIGTALRRMAVLSDESPEVRARAEALAEKYDPTPEEPTPEPVGPRYPHVEVQLSDEDGNASMIVGRVRRALRRAGVPSAEIDRFQEEATSGDYSQVIFTATRWVTVS